MPRIRKYTRRHVKAVEVWTVRGPVDPQTGKPTYVQVNKIATRVRAGAVGGNRPGTFHGATNFVSKHTSPR